ncbi:MAG: hypothetical protein ABIJ75_03640 [Actinomycetota bacterium]
MLKWLKHLILACSIVALGAGLLIASDTFKWPVPGIGLTAGDLFYAYDVNTMSNITAVASGQVFTSAGTGTKPAWSASPTVTTLNATTVNATTVAATTVTGTVSTSAEDTDGTVFLPAVVYCVPDTTNLTPVRVAAGNWGLRRTATGAETYNIVCDLNSWLQRTTTSKGVKINSIGVHYGDTVANLTSHTFNGIYPVTYASGSAISVGTKINTSATLETASTTNPYMTTVTVTTPAYLPTAANKALVVDFTAVATTNGVYTLYGITVNFSRTDL